MEELSRSESSHKQAVRQVSANQLQEKHNTGAISASSYRYEIASDDMDCEINIMPQFGNQHGVHHNVGSQNMKNLGSNQEEDYIPRAQPAQDPRCFNKIEYPSFSKLNEKEISETPRLGEDDMDRSQRFNFMENQTLLGRRGLATGMLQDDANIPSDQPTIKKQTMKENAFGRKPTVGVNLLGVAINESIANDRRQVENMTQGTGNIQMSQHIQTLDKINHSQVGQVRSYHQGIEENSILKNASVLFGPPSQGTNIANIAQKETPIFQPCKNYFGYGNTSHPNGQNSGTGMNDHPPFNYPGQQLVSGGLIDPANFSRQQQDQTSTRYYQNKFDSNIQACSRPQNPTRLQRDYQYACGGALPESQNQSGFEKKEQISSELQSSSSSQRQMIIVPETGTNPKRGSKQAKAAKLESPLPETNDEYQIVDPNKIILEMNKSSNFKPMYQKKTCNLPNNISIGPREESLRNRQWEYNDLAFQTVDGKSAMEQQSKTGIINSRAIFQNSGSIKNLSKSRSKTFIERGQGGIRLIRSGMNALEKQLSFKNSKRSSKEQYGSAGNNPNGIPGLVLEKDQALAALNEFVQQEDPDEVAAKRAFKILADILKKARDEKARKFQEEMQKLKRGDDIIEEADLEKKLMRGVQNRYKYVLYPDDKFKQVWDLVMTVSVILTCIISPYMLAFSDSNSDKLDGLSTLDTTLNVLFFFDICINFVTAYYDCDYNIIDNPKEIASSYLWSWCITDLVSVIPFDVILMYGNVNRIARFTRIGKFYKIIRMTKMVRLLKIAKVRNKLVKNLSEVLRIGVGFERLLFLMVIFLVMIHVISCFWIFIAKFDDLTKDNWIYAKGIIDYSDYNLYITSFYFSVTTVVTVGYGDITAQSAGEKLVAVVLMITGVVAFSFATGALSSIISSYDSTEAKYKEKIQTLNEIQGEYGISDDLYAKLVKTIKYDHSKKTKDTLQFMEELPHKLKLELAMQIHRKMYSSVAFFQKKDGSFIAWVGTVIHPINIQEQDYICREGEEIQEIYFLVIGNAAAVLPRYDNKCYQWFDKGSHFGHTDLFGVRKGQIHESLLVASTRKKKRLYMRRFTMQAQENCELLTLSVPDLDKMRIEFFEVYTQLFENSTADLKNQLKEKKKLLKECIQKEEKANETAFTALLFKSKKPALALQVEETQNTEEIIFGNMSEDKEDIQNEGESQKNVTLSRTQSKLNLSRNASQMGLGEKKSSSRRNRRQERKNIREQTILNISKAFLHTDDDDFKNECSYDEGEGTPSKKEEETEIMDDLNILNLNSGNRHNNSRSHSKHHSNMMSDPNIKMEKTRNSKHDFEDREERKNERDSLTQQFDVPIQASDSNNRQNFRKQDGSLINIIVEQPTVQQQIKKPLPINQQIHQEDSAIGQGAFGKSIDPRATESIKFEVSKQSPQLMAPQIQDTFLDIYPSKIPNIEESDGERQKRISNFLKNAHVLGEAVKDKKTKQVQQQLAIGLMRQLSARQGHKGVVKFGDSDQANFLNGSDLELSADDDDYDSFEEETLHKMSKIENELSQLKSMYVTMVNRADDLGNLLNHTLKEVAESKRPHARHSTVRRKASRRQQAVAQSKRNEK